MPPARWPHPCLAGFSVLIRPPTRSPSTHLLVCCRPCGYSAVCCSTALQRLTVDTSCDQTRFPRRLPSPLLLLCMLNFQSYSAPPFACLALLRLAPPCLPPNTPPHACLVVHVPCCSTPCATVSLTVYHRMARASDFPSSPHPTVSSLSQSFAHTLTHTHSSPRPSRALSIVPFTYLTSPPPPRLNIYSRPPSFHLPVPLPPLLPCLHRHRRSLSHSTLSKSWLKGSNVI